MIYIYIYILRMVKTRKNGTNGKNGTKKCKPTSQELTKYCSQSGTFKSFEKGLKFNLAELNQNIEKELIEMFNHSHTPSKYTEKSDYYSFINYNWIEKETEEATKKKEYFAQLDSFRITQDKVNHDVINLVKDYVKNNNTPKSKALGNLYDSLLNLDDKETKEYVGWVTDRIDKVIASNDLYLMLAEINQNEIISWGSPIVWNVFKDEKNTKIYRSYLSPPRLTVYDYTMYIEGLEVEKEKKDYRDLFKKTYLQFIDDMFDACLGKGHGLKSSDVWDCEYDMLNAMGCETIKNEDENGYNLLTTNDAKNKCGLDWDKLATLIGYKDVPNKFVCSNQNYIKCILELLTTDDTWKTDKWRTYYMYIVFRQLIRFHSKWRDIHYDFFGKFVKGIPIPIPRDIYPLAGLSLCFDNLLATEYIKKYKHQERIDYVHNMCTDLLTVFKRIITRNKWLSPITKKHALQKLDHINLIVGRPDELSEDPVLAYKSRGAYQNLKMKAKWRYKKMIALDGKSSNETFPVIDWSNLKLVGKQPYIVNAFYTPTENSIYIPLAYLQDPFIDLSERGIEYNLAYIGYTLTHEMSHCLDDSGSKYDYKGNLNNWWTKTDRAKFNVKVKDVIKQYEHFAKYDGIIMDASLSTGENLADISGLAICVEYLKDFQEKNDMPIPMRALSFKSFFTYIAIQSRQKIYDAAVKAQLKTNPHPMNKYRTNCPLTRLALFQSVYNIKKGDKMYWSNTDTIW